MKRVLTNFCICLFHQGIPRITACLRNFSLYSAHHTGRPTVGKSMANEWNILEISFPRDMAHNRFKEGNLPSTPFSLMDSDIFTITPMIKVQNVHLGHHRELKMFSTFLPPKTGEDQWRIFKAFGTRMLALICPEKMCYYSDNFFFGQHALLPTFL